MLEIVVGNIGTVYSGDSWSEAKETYWNYVEQSKAKRGRAAGEDVTWFLDGEIHKEYEGTGQWGSLTYADLLERLQQMSPEELQQAVTVYPEDIGEFFSITEISTVEEEDVNNVLDAGHVYLIF